MRSEADPTGERVIPSPLRPSTGPPDNHTTRQLPGGESIRVRRIYESEILRFASGPVFVAVIASLAAGALLFKGGTSEEQYTLSIVVRNAGGFGICLAVANLLFFRTFVWKELILIGVSVWLLSGRAATATEAVLAMIAASFMAIGYARLWRRRAIWESCILAMSFLATAAGYRYGMSPSVTAALFGILAMLSVISVISIVLGGMGRRDGPRKVRVR